MAPDDLDRWIDDLRGHAERGDLLELPPFNVGDGTLVLPGETTVRIMLADLDHLDGLPSAAREWLDLPNRRGALLDAFRRLRELLG